MKPLAALAACLLLAGCSAVPTPTPTPTTFAASGTLDLAAPLIYATPGAACSGTGGYADIKSGAQVSITDAGGKVVALGILTPGLAVDKYPSVTGCELCRFAFAVADIPGGDSIYGVQVSHRGVVQFKRADANQLQLTLG